MIDCQGYPTVFRKRKNVDAAEGGPHIQNVIPNNDTGLSRKDIEGTHVDRLIDLGY